MAADFAGVARRARETQLSSATVVAILRNRDDRQFVRAIGQREAITERAVRAQTNRAPANRDVRVGFDFNDLPLEQITSNIERDALVLAQLLPPPEVKP